MTSIKQIFFFIFIFVLYCITYFIGHYFGIGTNNGKLIFVISSVIFTLALYGYVEMAGLFKESFLELSPRVCKGGPFFWTDDGPISQYCKALSSTPEGIAKIEAQSCGKGYVGKPINHFEDTPMSNDCWQNEMCS
jgi:hypothetical protein